MSREYSKITLILALLSILFCLLSVFFFQFPLITVFKAIPTLLLIILTVQTHRVVIKNLLLTALSFSLIGDITLSLPFDFALRFGILAFIFAQYAYISLFLKNAEFENKRIPVFLVILILITISFYGLYPYLKDMKIPVIVFSCWLISMVFCAFHVKQQTSIISTGSLLFACSALCFAINQFIFSNDKFISILSMYFYYTAQFLLVIGVLEMKKFITDLPYQPVAFETSFEKT